LRLFVALELDGQAEVMLADYQHRLAALEPAVRWVRPEQIHLTLQFLGEVTDTRVMEIARSLDALSDLSSFYFEIGGVGTFGSPRAARVIWAGVHMPNPALAALQKKCEGALAELGYAPEGRAYMPHLTLGRVKDPRAGGQIAEVVAGLQLQASGQLRQTASEVVLFESTLGPQGSQYVVVHKVLLDKG
jgi:2'-5' RNA ligase